VRGQIVRTVEACLGRLNTPYVDLFSLHRLNPALPVDEVIAGLDDVVRAGKVRYVGASTMRPTQFARLVTLAKQASGLRFVAMQNLHNLLYREEEHDMNPFCVEEEVSTTPYSPLARGVLSGARLGGGGTSERAQSDGLAARYNDARNTPAIEAVVALAAARSAKPSQIALAWLLAKPAVGAPVIGATRLEHISDAAAASDLVLTQEEMTALEAHYVPTAPIFA
jgi:aryl-alcohol dehydrogenase (NADP+)